MSSSRPTFSQDTDDVTTLPSQHISPLSFTDEVADAGVPFFKSLTRSLKKSTIRFGFLDALSAYRLNGADIFAGDAAAGIVVAVMLIPQAMAYAQLSGMPPVTGFFAAIMSLFIYPVFGSSGHQAVGPVALLALMTQAALSEVVESSVGQHESNQATDIADRYARLAAKLAFLIGITQMILGTIRAGYILNFMSHSVLAGFTASSAIIIAASQLSKAFGFSTPQRSYVWQTIQDIGVALSAGKLHGLSLGLFVINMILFYGLTEARIYVMKSTYVKSRPMLKAFLRIISVALVVVTFNILLVAGLRLDQRGVKVLGRIPSGMPPFASSYVFDATFSTDLVALLPSALLISLVSFVESASVAKSMQAKFGITQGTLGSNDNQELLGLGLANLATSIFSGFPVTGGFSRSTVNSEAGAKTVMAGVFSGAILSIVVSFVTSWFYYLPDVSLSALIMFSALRLLETDTIRYLWTVDRGDAFVWATTVIVTLGAGIELGLLVGACVSILRVVEKAAQPHTAVLGRMPDGKTFRNIRRFPTLAAPVPGLVIVRLDGPLFFANVALFVDRVVHAAFPLDDTGRMTMSTPTPSTSTHGSVETSVNNVEATTGLPSETVGTKSSVTLEHSHLDVISLKGPTRAVLLDFSGVSSIDSAGVHAISETIPAALSKAAGEIKLSLPRLFLVGARGPVRDKLQAGERAHHNATALAGKPGCVSTIWRSINTLSSRRFSTSTTGTVTTRVDQPNIHDHENNELSHVPVSDSDVSLGNLYSGSSPSTSLVSGKRGIRRDYSSSAIVEALVSNVDPVTGDIPTEVLTMLWHVDLLQGVEAIVAVLEREQRQQMSN
jgi:SulP family sulfate permease